MVVNTLACVTEKLTNFNPKKKWYRKFCQRSAVAVILKKSALGLEVLMIKRAEREGDPWSGHMGFPGGKADDNDSNSLETARRETLEEIGLETQLHAQQLARLSDIFARPRGRQPMVITPYVFTIESIPDLNPNEEVDRVIWVPLAFFADINNRQRMPFKIKKTNIHLPCYFYQEQRIWGLSLRMLDELVTLIRK